MARCLKARERGTPHITRKSDEKIIASIEDACSRRGWYKHHDPYHRMYLHLLYEEAAKRGLNVTQFTFPT